MHMETFPDALSSLPRRLAPKRPRKHGVWRRLAELVALGAGFLTASAPARAQWTAADAKKSFQAYNQAFLLEAGTHLRDYRVRQGSDEITAFWVASEEIELAEDAYQRQPSPEMKALIDQLCAGFVAQHGVGAAWNVNVYDDDLMWATIAFTRASSITGNRRWLRDAEAAFQTVWTRGYDTEMGGGIWWRSDCEKHCAEGFKNSPANWTFVIAGYLLHAATGNETYRTEAATVHAWARKTLYVEATGRVHDGVRRRGVVDAQYSYNYGIAIGAFTFSDDPKNATQAAVYMMDNLSTDNVNGHRILPNYGQGGGDGAGFHGIALRWTGYALAHKSITDPAVLPWAHRNVEEAWTVRNAAGVSWNNWSQPTPATGLYSWDASDALVGLLDIPAP